MRLRYYLNERVKFTGQRDKDRVIREVKRWQSDLRKLTKAYKSIPNEDSPKALKAYKTVKKAFMKFSQNFENWIYGTILTREGKDESYYEGQVREKAWSAITSLWDTTLFPEVYDYEKRTHVPCPSCFDAKTGLSTPRDSKIKSYQRKFREAFEAIQEMVEMEVEKIEEPEYKPEDRMKVGKVNVVIHNYGKKKAYEKYIKQMVQGLQGAINSIKRAGFTNIDKDLTVHGYYTSKAPDTGGADFLTGGNYNKEGDILRIFMLGMSAKNETLIHELGHRFYYRFLPPQARKSWKRVINERKIKITNEHIEEFLDMYHSIDKTDMFSKQFFTEIANIIDYETDPVKRSIFEHLMHNISSIWFNEPDKVEKFTKRQKDKEINLEHITDYGNTDESEAFADAFRNWVMKGPRSLKAWTRAFFKDIVSAGGVSLKEELINKYLDSIIHT